MKPIKLALVRALGPKAYIHILSPYSSPIQPIMSVPYAISRFYPWELKGFRICVKVILPFHETALV